MVHSNSDSFFTRWQNKGDEKSDTHTFWLELLRDVLGFALPEKYIQFEKRVELSHVSFIDAYIPSTGIIIEQKSRGVNLDSPAKQSDGTNASPFEQAKRYYDWLPASEKGRYIITCNFSQLRIHDMEHPKAPPRIIPLEELEHSDLSFIVRPERELTREEVISLEAGRLVGKLYDSLLKRYAAKNDPESLRSLNILCVRIVFLLYSEDSGIFSKAQFHDFLNSHASTARTSLQALFSILDTPEHDRSPYTDDDLAAFPYINGGLFSEQNIEIPKLDAEIISIILAEMSEGFDWSEINPTIFGALFESTLNPDTRQAEGMHYTSIQNIHRVIDPLFLDDLYAEFREIIPAPKATMTQQTRRKLLAFQDKISSLKFLDPACGSGNFLTETYLSLRRLENSIIEQLTHGQINFAEGTFTPIKVSISQFYGIEINDFAVSVAKTALWIAEHQMMKATKKLIQIHDDFIPLKSYSSITEANAVQINWADVVPPAEVSYVMGNPPFRGARIMKAHQKQDISSIFKGWGSLGNFDYVCCWYKKAHDFIKGTDIKAALVSTNSINQGDTVSIFWKPLFDDGLHINFAYNPFTWDNEASEKAHVTCTVVGFSRSDNVRGIYTANNDGTVTLAHAEHINAYLLDAPDWWVFNRKAPIIITIPAMRIGNKLVDGGYYLFTPEEYEEFIRKESEAAKYFHLIYGGYEFLHNVRRYCLYLGNCTPHQIKSMPECYKRVKAVREWRLASKSKPTQKLADTPTRFHVETFPEGNYIVIPQTSSEKREYIPMGFLDESVMCTDALFVIPGATLYHFGVLMSSVHMAWMRVVCGRLEMRYRYSSGLVYNNFVWPSVPDGVREGIERTAQGILDARAECPDSSLAELYDDAVMPYALRMAHRANDEAVREAYGFGAGLGELEVVGRLMGMYEELRDGRR